MFSDGLHLTGSAFSLVVPFSCGPRHCGQLSADTAAIAIIPNDRDNHARCIETLLPGIVNQIG